MGAPSICSSSCFSERPTSLRPEASARGRRHRELVGEAMKQDSRLLLDPHRRRASDLPHRAPGEHADLVDDPLSGPDPRVLRGQLLKDRDVHAIDDPELDQLPDAVSPERLSVRRQVGRRLGQLGERRTPSDEHRRSVAIRAERSLAQMLLCGLAGRHRLAAYGRLPQKKPGHCRCVRPGAEWWCGIVWRGSPGGARTSPSGAARSGLRFGRMPPSAVVVAEAHTQREVSPPACVGFADGVVRCSTS